MPYAYHLRSHCRGCNRERLEGETFSARGKCRDCGLGPMVRNIVELHEHTGDSFLRWRRSMAAAVGAVLWEDLEDDTREDAA